MTLTTIQDLRNHLQWAIQVELTTVPTYLYAMYSIKNQASESANVFGVSVCDKEGNPFVTRSLLAPLSCRAWSVARTSQSSPPSRPAQGNTGRTDLGHRSHIRQRRGIRVLRTARPGRLFAIAGISVTDSRRDLVRVTPHV